MGIAQIVETLQTGLPAITNRLDTVIEQQQEILWLMRQREEGEWQGGPK